MAYATGAYADDQQDRRRLPVGWIVGAVAALAVVGVATLTTTRAAFTASTGNTGSSFAAGTVNLTDDDANSVMFNLTDMVPGSTQSRCVKVTYAGVPANVHLYGVVGSTATAGNLAPHLTTTIEEGTSGAKATTFDCTNFAATSTVHGPNLTLADFATKTDFTNGIPVFGGAPTGNAVRNYRITVTLKDENAAQGKNANATFTWEAQNS
jgi:hypothetical protein